MSDPFRDRWSPGIPKQAKKLFRGFTAVMGGLSDIGASKGDVHEVRRIIEPYLAPIAEYLSAPGYPDEVDNVNAKQASEGTVHGSPKGQNAQAIPMAVPSKA